MKTFLQALRCFAVLALITGLVYPVITTGLATALFPHQAHGSVLKSADGKAIGSVLLAQEFKSPRYFWVRPSGGAFATVPSGASNLGPTSLALKQAIGERTNALRQAHGLSSDAAVPEELVQASGSGLDPHVSPEAAVFQVKRVCQARGWNEAKEQMVKKMIEAVTEFPQWGVFGEARVNVLKLNLEIDTLGL